MRDSYVDLNYERGHSVMDVFTMCGRVDGGCDADAGDLIARNCDSMPELVLMEVAELGVSLAFYKIWAEC